ncbi:phosphotransferase enzyme family protein [Paenibacillus sp. GYB003]|uniref:phosphotransferase enzyme family protein n=1 Tax=Paenibacillus sp. GYB003 TaxID=2994392 RepID=UPI002F966600
METEREARAVREALRFYGFPPNAAAEPLSGGTANRNYAVRRDGRTFILRRRSAKYSDEAWIDYEEQYLLHMGRKGIPVPVPLPGANGARRSGAEGMTFQLLPYRGGEAYAPLRTEQLEAAGSFLGRLHRAAADFRPTARKRLPRFDDPAAIAEALKRILRDGMDMSASERHTIEWMLDYAEGLKRRLPDEAYCGLPQTIVHGDFHPANVAFRGGAVSALYDFDWICEQPRLRDVADLVVYFAALRAEPLDGGSIYSLVQSCAFDADRAITALRAYAREAGDALSGEEAAALPDLMAARLLHSRVQALAKVPPERAIGVLTGGIEPPLTWLDDNRDSLAARIAGRL